MGQLPFICFCWSFPTAALQGNCIVLETAAFWRTVQGSSENTVIQTLGSLNSRTSVSAGHMSSFINPNSVTYRVPTTSRLPWLLQHYLSQQTQTAGQNNHHLFWQ